MHMERLLQIIKAPRMTEKGTRATADRQYVFVVSPDAHKREIAKAVEELFKVVVDSVRVLNVKGKRTGRSKRIRGQRASWRKAYVKLKEGQQIDLEQVGA